MIIAIDGKVATGKSTVAKGVAKALGFISFDTGAMYRCFTWGILRHKINPDSTEDLKKYLSNFSFGIQRDGSEVHYFVEGNDVTRDIRQEGVTALVSQISALPFIRETLVEVQRTWAQGFNAVFEGRDIGTVVFPKADLKIFLTATAEERAKRRLEEWRAKNPREAKGYTLERMVEEINERDVRDSTREVSPLKKADDAVEIDTTGMTPEAVIREVVGLARKRMGASPRKQH